MVLQKSLGRYAQIVISLGSLLGRIGSFYLTLPFLRITIDNEKEKERERKRR